MCFRTVYCTPKPTIKVRIKTLWEKKSNPSKVVRIKKKLVYHLYHGKLVFYLTLFVVFFQILLQRLSAFCFTKSGLV